MNKYFNSNKEHWDQRVAIHLKSNLYNMDAFLEGESSLKHPEMEFLSDLNNKKVLHLQCHFGQDSLSMQRMGAKVTGVDLSSKSIEAAKKLNQQLNLEAKFIECNVLDAHLHIDEKFDLVYTSYGTIVWIPKLNQWAENIANFLKPGGSFLIVDFHPVMYMLDDNYDQFGYPYFTQDRPFHSFVEKSYTGGEDKISGDEYFWNHPLSSVFSALKDNELVLNEFKEFPYSCYNCFPNMEEIGKEKYQFIKHKGGIPYMFLMLWQKKSLV